MIRTFDTDCITQLILFFTNDCGRFEKKDVDQIKMNQIRFRSMILKMERNLENIVYEANKFEISSSNLFGSIYKKQK